MFYLMISMDTNVLSGTCTFEDTKIVSNARNLKCCDSKTTQC